MTQLHAAKLAAGLVPLTDASWRARAYECVGWPFDGTLDWVGVLLVHIPYLCAHWLTRVQVGGARGERLVETRHAWMLQRPLFEYAALASALTLS